MPFIQIDLDEDAYGDLREKLSQSIHDAQIEALDIPADDLFQVHRPHAPGEVRLGGASGGHPMVIRITMVHRYPMATKRGLYSAIERRVHDLGVQPEDLRIVILENGYEDWYAGRL
ncbi:tautomerase family protein [Gryllotalpicola reticulitermitis]|uniref:Tautomerase family protein n=2 Tax=Gryllotalpicola reticulitermitis TaxID=1184153 RepID=A0ABV8Q4K4_9MICO